MKAWSVFEPKEEVRGLHGSNNSQQEIANSLRIVMQGRIGSKEEKHTAGESRFKKNKGW